MFEHCTNLAQSRKQSGRCEDDNKRVGSVECDEFIK